MSDESPPEREDLDDALADAIGHPIQGRILAFLNEGPPKSAREISARLEVSVDKARYHLRRLRERGLIEATEERARRGVVEHYYQVLRAPLLDGEQLERLSRPKRTRAAVIALGEIFADSSHALRAGTLHGRFDHLTRVRMEVDSRGWKELLAIHRTAFTEVERVKAEAERRRGNEEDWFWVTSALLCFECPPRE